MIYHYTNIETLAQILKNKTLLFNRLDCVDDLEEGSVVSSGIYVGRISLFLAGQRLPRKVFLYGKCMVEIRLACALV